MKKDSKLSSFGQFFCNYGEFHDNYVNKAIHIICIPLIGFSLMFIT